jgi:septal ring factor EnvC (AmiA/AmiB activator)
MNASEVGGILSAGKRSLLVQIGYTSLAALSLCAVVAAGANATMSADCQGSKAAEAAGARLSLPKTPRLLCPVRGHVVIYCWQRNEKELTIASRVHAPVRAVLAGRVAFAGEAPKGLGRLIAIRHAGGLVSLYAGVGDVKVAKNDQVSRGQVISFMNKEQVDQPPKLVVQLRERGKILDPNRYLACD